MFSLKRITFLTIISIFTLSCLPKDLYAQSNKLLSAEDSDPRKLGWMTGFPPPEEKLIMQPESDYFSFPKLRWTVCHIRELMPTKEVSSGLTSSNTSLIRSKSVILPLQNLSGLVY